MRGKPFAAALLAVAAAGCVFRGDPGLQVMVTNDCGVDVKVAIARSGIPQEGFFVSIAPGAAEKFGVGDYPVEDFTVVVRRGSAVADYPLDAKATTVTGDRCP